MAKIYVSSTYEDLKEYRKVVYEELRKMRQDVIAVEDYVAQYQRPLQACLEDVAYCDIYIGIFAWRYGFIPEDKKDNPNKLSITELEYRKAKEKDIPCLIFLLDEHKDWPLRFIDGTAQSGIKSADNINRFRNNLKNDQITSFFENPDQLSGRVVIAANRILQKLDPTSNEKVPIRGIKLEKYLLDMENLKNHKMDLDDTCLSSYYVPHDATWEDIESWNTEDKDVYDNRQNEFNEIQKLIEIFLNCEEWYLIIGGSKGVGKTALSRIIASTLATKCLESLSNSKKVEGYIPILISLNRGLDNVYKQKSLQYVLDNIISPNNESREEPILVIVDEEDGFISDLANIKKHLQNLKEKSYGNMKAIFISRCNNEEKHSFIKSEDKYIRILPFNNYKFNEFVKKSITFTDLNYTIDYSNSHPNMLIVPQFARMALKNYTYLNISLKNLNNKIISTNAYYSLICLIFFNSLQLGHKYLNRDHGKMIYIKQRRALRQIAAVRQTKKGIITLNDIQDQYNLLGLNFIKSDSILPFFNSYHSQSHNDNNDYPLEDISDLFADYLLAEYYIQNIVDGNISNLNIGRPPKETIWFIDGLIELMFKISFFSVESSAEWNILKVFEDICGERQSYNLSELRNLLLVNTAKIVNSESITIHNDFTNKFSIETSGKCNLYNIDYQNLWISRWISLCILNKIHYMDEKFFNKVAIDKDKLLKLIDYTVNIIPYYFKNFYGVDLSKADLSKADLSGANLAGANLSGADLSKADLSEANLCKSNLVNCILLHTTLYKSDLTAANLTDAITADNDFLQIKISKDTKLEGTTIIPDSGGIYINNSYKEVFDINRKIRFIGIFDTSIYKFIFACRREDIIPLLTEKDKVIMLHISLSAQTFRKSIEKDVGRGLYVLEEYGKVKRVTIPLEEGYMILMTLEKDAENVEETIKDVYDLFNKGNKSFIYYTLSKTDILHNTAINQDPIPKIKNIEDLFDRIIRVAFDKIRYVCISDSDGIIKHEKLFPNVEPKLDQGKRKKSIIHALKRWKLRHKFAHKIGMGIYAMAVYEKMKRITFPLIQGNLLLITLEIDSDHIQIINHILKLLRLLEHNKL